ncbi:MAG: hypothetical protein BHW37_04700 [Firmicutes bacterium CAG:272_52_7]|nr:MAG: hypothetical protein BHW37_04700 [Firmicutes bacterium CAG:272_52_7]
MANSHISSISPSIVGGVSAFTTSVFPSLPASAEAGRTNIDRIIPAASSTGNSFFISMSSFRNRNK